MTSFFIYFIRNEEVFMLYSLALIMLSGIIIRLFCKKLNISSLIGFILVGILLGPSVLNRLDPTLLNISADIRQIVLIIILTRLVLYLYLKYLIKIGRSAL